MLHLFRRRKNDDDVRFKVFRSGEPMTLSDVLPVLHSLGVQVQDERPYEVRRSDGPLYIYDFGLTLPAGAREIAEVRTNVENAFAAAWRRRVRSGPVQRAGVPGRTDLAPGRHPAHVREVPAPDRHRVLPGVHGVDVRRVPGDRGRPGVAVRGATRPVRAGDRVATVGPSELVDAIREPARRGHLAGPGPDPAVVPDPDHGHPADVVLPALAPTAGPSPYVAIKLDPQAIPDLPAPRPRFEIFVYSPRFEGVHLRFGAVARGGLRWSDRREDFRTEVLGLVKAQTVKNAVIVPVGAKGGFVLKQAPADREALRPRGWPATASSSRPCSTSPTTSSPARWCRRPTWSATTATTRTWWSRRTRAPPPSPTSPTRSPAAYGFWLGDAFASGGSAGYDHKKMGITAQGRLGVGPRHFPSMGWTPRPRTSPWSASATCPATCSATGCCCPSTSGWSRRSTTGTSSSTRHPDPASSYRGAPAPVRPAPLVVGRLRPGAASRPAAGSGRGPPRRSRSRRRCARRWASPTTVTALAPTELIRAILLAPVDLLWNGGIGTYVKATTGDPRRRRRQDQRRGPGQRRPGAGHGGRRGRQPRADPARPDRVRPARRSDGTGRICTDFIDNSAGVDCSDHEVNIKILLGGAVADGALTLAERDDLLVEMTDEVAAAGAAGQLRPGRHARHRPGPGHVAVPGAPPHDRRDGDRPGTSTGRWRALPTEEELDARPRGGGLTSPELAVLLAYTKIIAEREIDRVDPARRRRGPTRSCATTSRPRCGSATPTGWPGTGCAARSSPPRW